MQRIIEIQDVSFLISKNHIRTTSAKLYWMRYKTLEANIYLYINVRNNVSVADLVRQLESFADDKITDTANSRWGSQKTLHLNSSKAALAKVDKSLFEVSYIKQPTFFRFEESMAKLLATRQITKIQYIQNTFEVYCYFFFTILNFLNQLRSTKCKNIITKFAKNIRPGKKYIRIHILECNFAKLPNAWNYTFGSLILSLLTLWFLDKTFVTFHNLLFIFNKFSPNLKIRLNYIVTIRNNMLQKLIF